MKTLTWSQKVTDNAHIQEAPAEIGFTCQQRQIGAGVMWPERPH